jgi:hypothetical protein
MAREWAEGAFHRRVDEVGGNGLLVVILTAVNDPIVRLITRPDQPGTGTIDRALEAI